MLNTDLHNKNMKEESRMSLEDYIKYNTVYGDMNKNRPLKRELLEGIYESIQKEQLLVVDDVRSKSGGDGVAEEQLAPGPDGGLRHGLVALHENLISHTRPPQSSRYTAMAESGHTRPQVPQPMQPSPTTGG